MADNVAITAGSGTTVAADDVNDADLGQSKFQNIKVRWGAHGTVNYVDTASGKPMPVQSRGSDGTDRSKAINYLYATGTNGYIVSPFNVIGSTDISALANGNTVLGASQGGGANGKFSQTDFAHGIWGYVWLTVITAGWAVSAGGNITGWWLLSTDGGTTYEKNTANTALGRPPDWIIPIPAVTTAANEVYVSPLIRLPAFNCKVYVQNNTGATTGTGNHTITCGPIAVQY